MYHFIFVDMKFGPQPSSNLVEAIQTLIADRRSVDVRVRCEFIPIYSFFFYFITIYSNLRCKDHQPSDGLGAHRLILAAASSRLKEILLEVSSKAEEELICLHLPDYTSVEVKKNISGKK